MGPLGITILPIVFLFFCASIILFIAFLFFKNRMSFYLLYGFLLLTAFFVYFDVGEKIHHLDYVTLSNFAGMSYLNTLASIGGIMTLVFIISAALRLKFSSISFWLGWSFVFLVALGERLHLVFLILSSFLNYAPRFNLINYFYLSSMANFFHFIMYFWAVFFLFGFSKKRE